MINVAKKRKIKKQYMLIFLIAMFFVVYFISFKSALNKVGVEEVENDDAEISEMSDEKTLSAKLNDSVNIYIGTDEVSDVKIEEDFKTQIIYEISQFKKIRKPSNFKAIYEGYTDKGIKFSTDLNYLRLFTVNKEEYYKVPVNAKNEFKTNLDRSIYTSFSLVKDYKKWKKVEVIYNKDTAKIHNWKYKELAGKMVSKKIIGKIQPEKNKERSEYNFTIKIEGKNYSYVIETMGEDYLKITCKDIVTYYGTTNNLYNYLKQNIFKIKESK